MIKGRDGSPRIVLGVRMYTARYRDETGAFVEVPTRTKDKAEAERALTHLERQAVLTRAKNCAPINNALLTDRTAGIQDHLREYLHHLYEKRVTERYIRTLKSYLARAICDCGFVELSDVTPDCLRRWFRRCEAKGMPDHTRNGYRQALLAFCNWCLETRRVSNNPVVAVPKIRPKVYLPRRRRILGEEELVRLLLAARIRPLLDSRTVRRGLRKGRVFAQLRKETEQELDVEGWERAMTYKLQVLTGIRKQELYSITAAQRRTEKDSGRSFLDDVGSTKRRIWLREDLATDLKECLRHRLRGVRMRGNSRVSQKDFANIALLRIPMYPTGAFDKDLRLAGISKFDRSGRTVNMGCLRCTFCANYSKGGLSLQTAKAATRPLDKNAMSAFFKKEFDDIHSAFEEFVQLGIKS